MTDAVRMERCEPPTLDAGTIAVVPDALVPMLWWRDVPVLRNLRRKLTDIERFVLETGLTLGAVTAPEFAEVTSLPGQVLGGLTTGLVAGGALQPGGNGYAVAPEVAGPAAETQTITRQMHATGGFVLLPRHGDVLGVPADGGWLRELERRNPRPIVNAPVPAELRTANRDRFLAERVRAGAVAGADPDLVAVVTGPDDPPLIRASGPYGTALSPAYRCRARVGGTAERPTVRAVIRGELTGAYRTVTDIPAATDPAAAPGSAGSTPGAAEATSVDAPRSDTPTGAAEATSVDAAGYAAGQAPPTAAPADGPAGTIEVTADLSGAVGLVREWLTLADALADPAVSAAAWEQILPPGMPAERPPVARRSGPTEWEFLVSGTTAASLFAHGQDLARPVGLAVATDTAVVELVCRFVREDAAGDAGAAGHLYG